MKKSECANSTTTIPMNAPSRTESHPRETSVEKPKSLSQTTTALKKDGKLKPINISVGLKNKTALTGAKR